VCELLWQMAGSSLTHSLTHCRCRSRSRHHHRHRRRRRRCLWFVCSFVAACYCCCCVAYGALPVPWWRRGNLPACTSESVRVCVFVCVCVHFCVGFVSRTKVVGSRKSRRVTVRTAPRCGCPSNQPVRCRLYLPGATLDLTSLK